MKKSLSLLIISVFFVFWGTDCAPRATAPVEKPPEQQKPTQAVSLETKAAQEQKWEKVLAEARREGRVSIYTLWRPHVRDAVMKAFMDKYGITVEMIPFGRGAEMIAKAQAEQRAGLYLADIFGAGAGTLIAGMKPIGLLAPVKPWLIFSEIIEPQNWRGNRLPFLDDDSLAFAFLGGVRRNVLYNTEVVREGEITSVKDLLKPKYKGKIVINDPTVSGGGNAFMTHLAYNLWGEDKGIEFLTQLLKQQEAGVQRDNRLQIESVARGKHAIAFAPIQDLILEFQKIGAPLKIAPVEEDTLIIPEAGALGLPTKFAHTNASILFVNWLLSKEGQTVFSQTWGSPSNRIDVPTEGMDPLFIPKPGVKYFLENEESLKNRPKTVEWARRLIETLR